MSEQTIKYNPGRLKYINFYFYLKRNDKMLGIVSYENDFFLGYVVMPEEFYRSSERKLMINPDQSSLFKSHRIRFEWFTGYEGFLAVDGWININVGNMGLWNEPNITIGLQPSSMVEDLYVINSPKAMEIFYDNVYHIVANNDNIVMTRMHILFR